MHTSNAHILYFRRFCQWWLHFISYLFNSISLFACCCNEISTSWLNKLSSMHRLQWMDLWRHSALTSLIYIRAHTHIYIIIIPTPFNPLNVNKPRQHIHSATRKWCILKFQFIKVFKPWLVATKHWARIWNSENENEYSKSALSTRTFPFVFGLLTLKYLDFNAAIYSSFNFSRLRLIVYLFFGLHIFFFFFSAMEREFWKKKKKMCAHTFGYIPNKYTTWTIVVCWYMYMPIENVFVLNIWL